MSMKACWQRRRRTFSSRLPTTAAKSTPQVSRARQAGQTRGRDGSVIFFGRPAGRQPSMARECRVKVALLPNTSCHADPFSAHSRMHACIGGIPALHRNGRSTYNRQQQTHQRQFTIRRQSGRKWYGILQRGGWKGAGAAMGGALPRVLHGVPVSPQTPAR